MKAHCLGYKKCRMICFILGPTIEIPLTCLQIPASINLQHDKPASIDLQHDKNLKKKQKDFNAILH